jgi:hypothetical protein
MYYSYITIARVGTGQGDDILLIYNNCHAESARDWEGSPTKKHTREEGKEISGIAQYCQGAILAHTDEFAQPVFNAALYFCCLCSARKYQTPVNTWLGMILIPRPRPIFLYVFMWWKDMILCPR